MILQNKKCMAGILINQAGDMIHPTIGAQKNSLAVAKRLRYLQRIFAVYLTAGRSHLTFWHEIPELNIHFHPNELGEYYMTFNAKADYPGEYDKKGIPLLNYHGRVGLQYNPIAIAQYGLGNYNLYCRTKNEDRYGKFLIAAGWLVDNLERNSSGLCVWNHHFDWEYRTPLKAPWYSALSQGQGISVLVRAYKETGNHIYLNTTQKVFETFLKNIDDGGVTCVDAQGYLWFEETIVDPPTHILNGFIWALWGIYDYALATGNRKAQKLFDSGVHTLQDNLKNFDIGFWSLYEQSGTWMKMLASPFYHGLHIVQLRVMHRLTSEDIFAEYADRWEAYRGNLIKRNLALTYKALFKLMYY